MAELLESSALVVPVVVELEAGLEVQVAAVA